MVYSRIVLELHDGAFRKCLGISRRNTNEKSRWGQTFFEGLDSNHEIMPKRKRKSDTDCCTSTGRGRMVQQ
jgi:hypothetical protein